MEEAKKMKIVDAKNQWIQSQRKIHFAVQTFILPALLATIFLAGCSSGETDLASGESAGQSASANEFDQSKTTSVTVSPAENAQSPATATPAKPAPETAPDRVCKMFVEYLTAGNRTMAEQLLTPAAFSVTTRAQLQLEPVGSPVAKYEMGPPMYATNKQQLCQVDCKIIDEVDGKTIQNDITWMCRRKKDGWRIAGMMVSIVPGQPKDFLSFENVDDVRRIKGTLVDETSAEIRNANANDDATRLK